MFNKKVKKESIVENVNVLNNIIEHTTLIDNKRVCLRDIHEYLHENINDTHNNIKNKKYEKVLADLLLMQKHTFKSINRMHKYNVNKKITKDNSGNKKITKDNRANKKITKDNSANKKITKDNRANQKITKDNSANQKITNANSANDKITSANSANEKITNANDKITNANSANKKITNANNANEKSTDGNNANNNSTNTIKKSSITIRLKRPHVIY